MINRNGAQGIITKTAIGIKGKARVGEAGIEKTQIAEASETAFAEQDITELPHCQCGSLIKAVEDIGAVDCITNEYLCLACSSIKCSRCLKSVGVESRLNLFGNIYCKHCAKTLIIIVAAICLAVIIGIIYIISS